MKKLILVLVFAFPLAIGGLVYANTFNQSEPVKQPEGYTCPITGEDLPCEHCCPLNQ